jgi:hypothetical protein
MRAKSRPRQLRHGDEQPYAFASSAGAGVWQRRDLHPIAEVLKIAFADQGELPEPLRPYSTPKRSEVRPRLRRTTVLARDLLARVLELTRN